MVLQDPDGEHHVHARRSPALRTAAHDRELPVERVRLERGQHLAQTIERHGLSEEVEGTKA